MIQGVSVKKICEYLKDKVKNELIICDPHIENKTQKLISNINLLILKNFIIKSF